MSLIKDTAYLECTIHDLKTNISRYLRLLESGQYRGLVIRRYNKPVALMVPFARPQPQAVTGDATDDPTGIAAPGRR